jgi:hypothetical protein
MQHEIIDNFLDKEEFKNLQEKMFNNNFAWFMSQGISYADETRPKEYFFTHKFFEDYRINSSEFKDVLFAINKLEIKSLLRVKANLYIKTPKAEEHAMHKDYEFSHKAGILSLNTNNGFTKLADGTKIESVANRMLKFDAGEEHASVSCTDENYRANIIFNYF